MTREETHSLSTRIPNELHSRLELAALQRGQAMRDILIEVLDEALPHVRIVEDRRASK